MSTELITIYHGDLISKMRNQMQTTGAYHIPVVSGKPWWASSNSIP
jgi:hypothetical protein